MDENQLIHYGILGMKWGVRRSEAQLARARGKTPSSKSSEESNNKSSSNTSIKSSSSTKPKKASEMSDDELRKTLNRIQMEEQYNAVMARQNPDKTARAKKVVADLAEKTVRDVANKAIDKAIKEYFDVPEVDKITNYRVDLSKLGDKELKSAMNRAIQESKIQQIIEEMDKKQR